MIGVRILDVNGIDSAIHGMRNSYSSWDESDSGWTSDGFLQFGIIGPKDLELAKRLASAGGSHAKFRRMIHVQMDIKAPLYWWKQFDTYKIGTTGNSTSTMHTITKREFTIDDFTVDKVTDGEAGIMLLEIIKCLNSLREKYLDFEDDGNGYITKKMYWRNIIQLLPSSYNQMRTVDLNYEVLSKMVHERMLHKLDEWQEFCRVVSNLPYAQELIFCDDVQ